MLFQHTDWSRMELRLAENIARFRKSRGYTQEELAKRLSISSQAVSKWENAQSLPDISLLPALAGRFGTRGMLATDLFSTLQRIVNPEVTDKNHDESSNSAP